ncbi:hypothetical protein P7K49_027571 [Saguinus oedipus]|uniref:Uncharacterized protein n=1 Tax=Saguinus oedipus TaxID=9490 RepID=A0ABQ9UB55_SAGOE|nr:hypothetical protein P7K49_027571 [Saguinus oedipus]
MTYFQRVPKGRSCRGLIINESSLCPCKTSLQDKMCTLEEAGDPSKARSMGPVESPETQSQQPVEVSGLKGQVTSAAFHALHFPRRAPSCCQTDQASDQEPERSFLAQPQRLRELSLMISSLQLPFGTR